MTRRDVAEAAGVSPAVVSYVVNGGPRAVAPATRARVEEAIARLDYRPNAIASALRHGSTRSIGYLTPNPRDAFLAELSDAVERQFRLLGYIVLMASTSYEREREEQSLRSFVDRNVDGILLAPGIAFASRPTWDVGRPVVGIDPSAPVDGRMSVRPMDRNDARTAADHLARHHGRTLIGCVSGSASITSESARRAGWRDAVASADLPSGAELVSYGEVSEEGGYAAAEQLLSEHGRPWALHGRGVDGLVVTNDSQAVGVIARCAELGLSVPGDIAIVSVGGTRIAPYTVPSLTTVRQDVELLAELAVQRLVAQITGSSDALSFPRLEGNLVVGHSCGCDVLACS